MKIDEYYREVGRINLNGSLAALSPAIIIALANFLAFHNKLIMLLTIPFLIYSFVNFQLYIIRIKQSIKIKRNLLSSKSIHPSLFEARDLLVLFFHTLRPRLMIYFPDGHLAAVIKKYRGKGKAFKGYQKTYALFLFDGQLTGLYKVNGKGKIKIDVYNKYDNYIGSYERTKSPFMKKEKKELVDGNGRFVGAVEGALFYMDESVQDSRNHEVGRLHRGWMPVEWSNRFPDPNTPVLSFEEKFSEDEKILRMSFLINEYFLER
jgi:hypothetical protein